MTLYRHPVLTALSQTVRQSDWQSVSQSVVAAGATGADGAVLFAAAGAVAFVAGAFLAGAFLAGAFFAAFLAAGLVAFLAGAFFAAFLAAGLVAGFLAAGLVAFVATDLPSPISEPASWAA